MKQERQRNKGTRKRVLLAHANYQIALCEFSVEGVCSQTVSKSYLEATCLNNCIRFFSNSYLLDELRNQDSLLIFQDTSHICKHLTIKLHTKLLPTYIYIISPSGGTQMAYDSNMDNARELSARESHLNCITRMMLSTTRADDCLSHPLCNYLQPPTKQNRH